MKKRSIFVLLFVITFCLKGQTEEIKCRDVLDTASFRVLYRFDLLALKEKKPHIVTDTMALEVGDTWSKYYCLHRLQRFLKGVHNRLNGPYPLLWTRYRTNDEDLQKRLESKQEILEIEDWRNEGEPSILYKNRRKNEIMTVDNGPLEGTDTHTLFDFKEHIPPQDWLILEDTLTVMGYHCQKATTDFRGRSYTAWFTMDIPVDEGPWKLYGLPGLILKAEDSESIFRMEAMGLEHVVIPIDIIWEMNSVQDDRKIRTILKFIGGNMKQWHAYRKERFGKISMSFYAGDHVICYSTRNPIEYPEMEILE